MFLNLNHQKLDLYGYSITLVSECYRLTSQLPLSERFAMVPQIRRAALSVHLNIAEGASRRSDRERNRYYEISRGSIVEIDAALDIAKELGYLDEVSLDYLAPVMLSCFRILTTLIKKDVS